MSTPGLDEVVWQAWRARELPEGYRAEIIEGAIEVWSTGRLPHSRVAPEDLDAHEDGLGIDAAAVRLVVEVASPGRRNQDRDRIRKRREHARAGIPVYLLIDDYDGQGAVTLFTGPRPAKGFVIGEGITGPKRG